MTNAWRNLESHEWKAPWQHADQATLNMHIFKSGFVLEMRKLNCDIYPPKTLHQLKGPVEKGDNRFW